MRWSLLLVPVVAASLLTGLPNSVVAQEKQPAIAAGTPAPQSPPREQRLADYLTGARFVGRFSVDGKEAEALKEESYLISKCEKLAEPDMYRLTARIKYGDTDGEFPMDLKILWSGDTPVITLDQVWIPGLGTFSSRVLILNGRYAGTWDHGQVGGHLFGRIEKDAAAAPK
ncbi:MAG: hypothetical protein ACO1RT_05775 [Planctomycetaceae bacterium]